jgi:hypothetical protein
LAGAGSTPDWRFGWSDHGIPLLDMIGMCPVGRTCWRGELPAALQIGALFGAPTGFWWWFFYRRVLIRRAASQN